MNGLNRSRSSHAFAFIYDESLNEESPVVKLAKQTNRLTVISNHVAVKAGKFGKWRLLSEPSKEETIMTDLFFNEDALEFLEGDGSPKELWTGKGRCTLVDFKKFVDFLLSFSNSVN